MIQDKCLNAVEDKINRCLPIPIASIRTNGYKGTVQPILQNIIFQPQRFSLCIGATKLKSNKSMNKYQ